MFHLAPRTARSPACRPETRFGFGTIPAGVGHRYSRAVVLEDEWPELSLTEVLDGGIPPYASTELLPRNQAAVASWREGDCGAAMWLYSDPDDLALPFTHEIEVARWEEGSWRILGESAMALAPGGLTWRPTDPVQWTATAQVLLATATMWVLGGVARDGQVTAEVVQAEERRSYSPDTQSNCFLIGVQVPPQATVTVASCPPRSLGHWSGREPQGP